MLLLAGGDGVSDLLSSLSVFVINFNELTSFCTVCSCSSSWLHLSQLVGFVGSVQVSLLTPVGFVSSCRTVIISDKDLISLLRDCSSLIHPLQLRHSVLLNLSWFLLFVVELSTRVTETAAVREYRDVYV